MDDHTQPEIFGPERPAGSRQGLLVRFLVEPFTRLSAVDAFRARVVATLVLANLVISATGSVAGMIEWAGLAPGLGWIFGVSFAVSLGMYLLARTRHYRWSGGFLVLSVPAGVIPFVLVVPDAVSFTIAMCWLVIGIAIASFLLPGWAAVSVLALYLAIPPVMLHVVGHSPTMLLGLEIFIFTASFLILFHRWVIRRSERVAEQQPQARQKHVRARERAKATLSSRQEQLRITLDSIGDGVIATDPDGRITELNPTAAALVGVASRDILGQPVDQVLRLLDPDTGASTTLAELQEAGHAPLDAVLLQGASDVARRVEIARAPLRDAAGTRVGAVFTLRDHTDRLALEEQLQQVQRLEAVGRLAGGVAHDFNNLLFSISSLAELMEMTADEDFPFHKELQDILEAVDRGSTLTAQMLSFSRRQVLRLELLDLGRVASELAKMLHRIIGEDIELKYHTADGLALVRADRSQVEQILLNLALNARNAMPDGGRLTLETAHFSMDASDTGQIPDLPPGRYVLLAVSDSGCGMSKEVRERIFEPFFTTMDRGRGSGLGLSMVYGLVQQHGGHIRVHSAAGRGTVIKVYLPVAEPKADDAELAQAAQPPPQGAGETILLAEDEEMPRKLLARTLNQLGYRVIAASDGAHALEVAQEHVGPIHLLLTDVLMPRMAGPDLYRKLVAERPELRVVYLSGYTDSTVVEHGVLAEDAPFFRKPVSVRKLARTLRQVLSVKGEPEPSPPF